MMANKRALAVLAALFIGSIGVAILIFHPKVREASSNLFFNKERDILSLVKTTLYRKKYKIVKVRVSRYLYLEVYEWNEKGNIFDFVDRAKLTDNKDAFYKFESKTTNLFLKDVNQDKFPEIIVPSYDKNMIARLNVFSYDVDNKKLIKLSRH